MKTLQVKARRANKPNSINSLEKIVGKALNILQECKKIPQMDDGFIKDSQKTCHGILKDIHSKRLKIAVTGVIKSGKSTFINSIVEKDLVKRGAGVVTSITTRIRKGKKNRANIYFKSWDTINSQLIKALELFPDKGARFEFGTEQFKNFDIRRKKDRQSLQKIFKILTCDFPVSKKGIQPETILIKHALKGFDSCSDFVRSDETYIVFESKKFDKYKVFISDPANAFYIKDVCLEVYGKLIDPNIEIADCQGADSTDPGQLAHILNYIESANLIIYCISSRIGLRQADIVFLNQIKKLGLLDNIIFINNCDFTEHENFNDLKHVEKTIKDDLDFLEIKPWIFSFSSLYNFFKQCRSILKKRDLIRLELWQEEKQNIKYCDSQTREFNLFFQDVIDKNRYDFLVSNHFRRLESLMIQLGQQTNTFLDLLSSDNKKEKKVVKNLAVLEKNAALLETMVTNSNKGCVEDIKKKIKINIKDSFIRGQKDILNTVLDFVDNRSIIDVEQYKSTTKESFNQILYLMFQDFKRQLDLYVLENVKPELKKIIQIQEQEIVSYFRSLVDSFQIDLIKNDHNFPVENINDFKMHYDVLNSLENIRKILGLQLPATLFEARYTSKIKANVFTGFGLHTVYGILFSFFRKNHLFSFSPGLNRAALKIRKENLKLIKIQYKQLYKNLETNYFMPLIDAVARDFKAKIDEHFARYHVYKKEVEHTISLKQSEKLNQKNTIALIQTQIYQVKDDIVAVTDIF
jgi:hypothetical protein